MRDEEMLPESSPGEKNKSGIRKVNNIPIYILAGVIATFLLVMMIVASDRSTDQNQPIEEEIHTVNSALKLAEEIAGKHKSGIIQEDSKQVQQLEMEQPETTNSFNDSNTSYQYQQDYYVQEPGELNGNNSSELSIGRRVVGVREDEINRFHMMRLQMLEDAVKAKTTVQGFMPGAGRSISNNPRDQLTIVRQQLNETPSTTNPTQAYNSKIEKLKSLINGSGSNNSKQEGLPAFKNNESGDRWKLNSQPEAPETSYVLRAGFVIPGLLIRGINSELPGQITAQVSQNVYDTATGKYLLLPQGSRLVGTYSSNVVYGQSRVLIAWERIIYPDGKAMDIGGMQGSDSAGYSGFKDRVNTHFWKVFSSAFLMSGIVAGVNLSQDAGGGDAISNRQRASDAMSEALGQQLGQTLTQMIIKNLSIAPTLEIRNGYRFNVIVNKDMTFNKPYESFDYKMKRHNND